MSCSPRMFRKSLYPTSFHKPVRNGWRGRKPCRCSAFGQPTTCSGADTVVVIDSLVLGKPADAEDAARMLRLLSGRRHQVITGVCLVGPNISAQGEKDGFEDSRCETTQVLLMELSEEDIHAYVRTGEPMDKAGAYAIQGIASRWISRIEGDYSNVVGLPVALVYRMLREHKAI